MNVVGKVGSLISQGVYSVATPFHPFGGAVDIIVVQQEDGTYRSTPWYVRFGKFQGVLKSAEKVVSISVNGVENGFHMYLDNSGQAYFMREVSGSNDAESNNFVRTESNASESSTIGNFEKNTSDPLDCAHFIVKDDAIDTDENSYIATEEQASPNSLAGSSECNYHYGSLDEVEDMVKESDDSNSEMVLISVDGHVLTAPISSNEENSDNVQLDTPQFHLGPGEGSSRDFGPTADVWEAGFFGDLSPSNGKDNVTSESQLESPKDCQEDILCHQEAQVGENVAAVEVSPGHGEPQGTVDVDICYEDNTQGLSNDDMFRSCLDLASHADNFDSQDVASLSTESDLKDESRNSTEASSFMSTTLQETSVIRESDFQSDASDSPQTKTDGLKGNDYDVRTPKDNEVYQHIEPHDSSSSGSAFSSEENAEIYTSEMSLDTNNMSQSLESSCIKPSANDEEQLKTLRDSPITAEECNQNKSPDTKEIIFRLGFEISLCGNLLRPGMGHKSAEEAFEAHSISEQVFKSSGASIIKNGKLVIRYESKYLQWDKAAHIILGKAVFGSNFDLTPNEFIPIEHDEASKSNVEAPAVSPTVSRRWRLWPIPFRMSKPLQQNNSNSSSDELFADTASGLQNSNEENMTNGKAGKSPRKQFIRANIPTNEEIASLNLKEGQNMIAFSFSTRVFGRQQVDAHIYLWKWNARIVISDVDGTITKSDVLGQFMPLVGKDWTQSGVARLFSAIKENGYQLLFLSARAIVQAYLTRSFLLNLKQDGKALPSGPVVISPDGLFPSLYREVIRRAPHEFKIACLEDIKALFPSDYNPFYAGFGNRDTDELSYRKIGIPKGKIFIINPKGEVAINHCVDVKSYTSLHTLVHDMFPPTTLVEQEDYNSWNYWKIPLPSIDM